MHMQRSRATRMRPREQPVASGPRFWCPLQRWEHDDQFGAKRVFAEPVGSASSELCGSAGTVRGNRGPPGADCLSGTDFFPT